MKKKKHSRIWAVAGIILLGIVAVSSIYSHFGGFGTCLLYTSDAADE